MEGIDVLYRNNQNTTVEVTAKIPQYIFLEPYGKSVVRYYFKKNGIELDSTKLLNTVQDPGLLSVKIRHPKTPVISRLLDFSSVEEKRDPDSMYFDVSFEDSDTYPIDVLYQSKTNKRLKVKIYAVDEETESFENENTVTDEPDAYVKLVEVRAEFDKVFYTYVYRRDGRLKKYPSSITYLGLVPFVQRRLLRTDHPDYSMPIPLTTAGIKAEGYYIDVIDGVIAKEVDKRVIEITPEELGSIIQKYTPLDEIISLLSTSDYKTTQHPLIKEGETLLVACDSVCSYPPANKLNSEEQRNLVTP